MNPEVTRSVYALVQTMAKQKCFALPNHKRGSSDYQCGGCWACAAKRALRGEWNDECRPETPVAVYFDGCPPKAVFDAAILDRVAAEFPQTWIGFSVWPEEGIVTLYFAPMESDGEPHAKLLKNLYETWRFNHGELPGGENTLLPTDEGDGL